MRQLSELPVIRFTSQLEGKKRQPVLNEDGASLDRVAVQKQLVKPDFVTRGADLRKFCVGRRTRFQQLMQGHAGLRDYLAVISDDDSLCPHRDVLKSVHLCG